jgi:hypothetical protein
MPGGHSARQLPALGQPAGPGDLAAVAVHFGALLQLLGHSPRSASIAPATGHNRRHHAFLLSQQSQQQVRRFDALVVQLLRQALGSK